MHSRKKHNHAVQAGSARLGRVTASD